MSAPETTFIYALNDPITGRTRYVGKSNEPFERWRSHLYSAKSHHTTPRDQWISSLLIQGLEPALEVLEEVAQNEWEECEKQYIAFFKLFPVEIVNSNEGGAGPKIVSDETRVKMRLSRLGRKGKPHTPEQRAKASALRKGIPLSLERRQAISRGQTGRKLTPEWVAKIRAWHLGKKHRLGQHHTPEAKAKISAFQKTRVKSAEEKQKISEGMKRYSASQRAEKIAA